MAVVCMALLWLWKQQRQPRGQEAFRSHPALRDDIAQLDFAMPYASVPLRELRLDVAAFLAMYQETFAFRPPGDDRKGPLPQLFALKAQISEDFMDIEYLLPADMAWINKVRSVRTRTGALVRVYIEDVRERLQLSRYDPGPIGKDNVVLGDLQRGGKHAAAKRRAASAGLRTGMTMGMAMGMAMARRSPRPSMRKPHPAFGAYRHAQKQLMLRIPPRHLLVRKYRPNPLVRHSMKQGYRLRHRLPAKGATGLILIAHRPNPMHSRAYKQVLAKYKAIRPSYMSHARR